MLRSSPLSTAIGRLLFDPGLLAQFASDPSSAMSEMGLRLTEDELQRLVKYMQRLGDGSPASRNILARALQSSDRIVQR